MLSRRRQDSIPACFRRRINCCHGPYFTKMRYPHEGSESWREFRNSTDSPPKKSRYLPWKRVSLKSGVVAYLEKLNTAKTLSRSLRLTKLNTLFGIELGTLIILAPHFAFQSAVFSRFRPKRF